ncbi:MAG: hypothetical protein AMJ56_15115 [Anaerolineae bacterium SG8_19]|nr:MAG: hypothetical protein AMJ56_15115 [Anaerolineae bacterium SG8_19]
MIRYTLSQKNVLSYLIGLSLIAVAILVSWLVIQNLPTISPPKNVGLFVEAPGSAAVHPADRKFFDAGHMALLMTNGHINPWANVHPADRKFYTNEYATGSGESNVVNPLANVNPADRKFFTNGYAAGGTSGDVDPLAIVHPADRKFFTNGIYGSETP